MKRLLLSAAALAVPIYAQNVPPPPGAASDTYANQQREQTFATKKLTESPRKGVWASFRLKDRTLRAFVRYPDKTVQGTVPVVLVLHEVFGLTDSTRHTADQIAAMGYIAITPDMVSGLAPNGGGVADFPNARLTSDAVTGQLHANVMAQINAWAHYGLALPKANGKLAVVGLSWGGGASFRYAASADHHPALKAVFAFYDVGPPAFNQGPNRANNPPMDVAPMDVPVFGFYPTNDTRVMNSLAATRDALAKAGKAFYPEIYEGADHAFMRFGEDPANSNPANRAAVKASLERLKRELAKL